MREQESIEPGSFKNSTSLKRLICLAALVLAVTAVQAFRIPGCEDPEECMIGDLVINHDVPLKWTRLAHGLRFTRLDFTRTATEEREEARVIINAVGLDPRRFSFSFLRAPEITGEPVGWIHEMAGEKGSMLAVNASFYQLDNNDPIGLMVEEGVELNPWGEGSGSGVFWIKGGRARIELAKTFNKAWMDSDLAVQAGPVIVEPEGKPGIYSNVEKYRARTAVGINKWGKLVILCTARVENGVELSGLDLYELMQIMLLAPNRGGLGLKTALNLDGGTSTAIYMNHPELKLDVRSTHPVRNGIAVDRR